MDKIYKYYLQIYPVSPLNTNFLCTETQLTNLLFLATPIATRSSTKSISS